LSIFQAADTRAFIAEDIFTMCDPLEAQSHIDDYFNLVPDAHVNEYRNGKGSLRVQLLESAEKGTLSHFVASMVAQTAKHLSLCLGF